MILLTVICVYPAFFGVSVASNGRDPTEVARVTHNRSTLFFLLSYDDCKQLNVFSCGTEKVKRSNNRCAEMVQNFESLPESERKLCPTLRKARCRRVGLAWTLTCTVKTPRKSRLMQRLRWEETKPLKECATSLMDAYNRMHRLDTSKKHGSFEKKSAASSDTSDSSDSSNAEQSVIIKIQ